MIYCWIYCSSFQFCIFTCHYFIVNVNDTYVEEKCGKQRMSLISTIQPYDKVGIWSGKVHLAWEIGCMELWVHTILWSAHLFTIKGEHITKLFFF